ncbi:non-ribosomal peptide synthetase [Burkholderia humptydooensis]|uniref:Non-ribosomal peptide synthetase n=1 Tax=Burkholderia humptydooensis TaxID=430531 RepID=A0A7T2U995_9BURK|nr:MULTISPECIES: non-ribosomal peptide synthetase [Burkholderia]AJY38457.1 AMP-binding enzyme family protein [Burkholderia sp. 2002721687]QPS47859.1 non-ribosomal peptide synthetase [Burkholderia humptydooensis]
MRVTLAGQFDTDEIEFQDKTLDFFIRRVVECDSISQLFLQAVEQHSEAGYVIFDRELRARLIRYPMMLADARRVLAGLQSSGISREARVAIRLDEPREFFPVFWACLLGGYVPCPLPPLRGTDMDRAAYVAHVSALLDGPLFVTADKDSALLGDVRTTSVESLRAFPPSIAFQHASRDDLAMLMLTSGSTGKPKAVMLRHRNVLASMAGKIARQQLVPSDITLNWIACDHVASLLECHMLPLAVGAVQLHVPTDAIIGSPLNFIKLLGRYRVGMTFTPNFLLGLINQALARSAELEPLDLSHLKIIVSGGEAVVNATALHFLDRLARFGLRRNVLAPAFGMTETCAGSVYARDYPASGIDKEFAPLGMGIDGLTMRIVDAEGRVVPDGEPGELQLRGPMIFSGYLKNDDANAEAFTLDGWFRTGDSGRLDDGVLTLVGRTKESVIVHGVNYHVHEIETVLEQVDGIAESYVAAVPIRLPRQDSEHLAIFFHPTFPVDDADALYRTLTEIRERVVLHWGFRPSMILPLDVTDMPKTSLGKLQRMKLRKRFESGMFTAPLVRVNAALAHRLGARTPLEGDAEYMLADIYAEIFGLDASMLGAAMNFFELGGTSLDIIRFKDKVQRRFGLDTLPTVTLMHHPTIREFAAFLAHRHAREDATYTPLVPFHRSGRRTPLFCVHPGLGDVLVFANLAKHFIGERPFYALRARGFNPGERRFNSFDEMVETYLLAMRDVQPCGPYAIAGYSYGAAVAFEIARRLEARGERMAFVGIIDFPPDMLARMPQMDDADALLNLAFFLSLVDRYQMVEWAPSLRAMSRRERAEWLLSTVPARKRIELDLNANRMLAWADLSRGLIDIGRAYRPAGRVRTVQVFHATPLPWMTENGIDRHAWRHRELEAWHDCVSECATFVDVPGEHHTIIAPPHLDTFQARFKAALNASERYA